MPISSIEPTERFYTLSLSARQWATLMGALEDDIKRYRQMLADMPEGDKLHPDIQRAFDYRVSLLELLERNL